VVATKLVENSMTLDKLAWENSRESSREAEKMVDWTPHTSKIAFYIFLGPGHVMGDELIECSSLFLLNTDGRQGEHVSLFLSKRTRLQFDLIGDARKYCTCECVSFY
jgi:hypothetical protein